ncbi:MAG TPA: hypothetical protein VGR51_05425, partial [Thermoplasmata archaeon]|nr:hypothetical protein [Thermoplasmata archaeon]
DVLAPVEGSRVSGTVILSGTATPGAFILLRIDGGVWIDIGVAGGDGTWARPWDSAEVALGPHTLEFKATKDGQESAAVARHITVVQTAAAGGIPGIVLLAVGVALLFLALFAWRRRSRPARRPGVEDSAPPEGSSSQPR